MHVEQDQVVAVCPGWRCPVRKGRPALAHGAAHWQGATPSLAATAASHATPGRRRDGHALLFATRQLRREVAGARRQADPFDDIVPSGSGKSTLLNIHLLAPTEC